MFTHSPTSFKIPQREHARLAGLLAGQFGNADFPLPDLPIDSFIAGVAFHDRGYEPYDVDGIGEVSSERWLALQLRGAEQQSGDIVRDLVVQFHLHRLVLHKPTRDREFVAAKIQSLIDRNLAATSISGEMFHVADDITQLCDNISFDFCMGNSRPGTTKFRTGKEVRHCVENTRLITVAPWPFREAKIIGQLVAYDRDGYPDTLAPQLLPFEIRPGKTDSKP